MRDEGGRAQDGRRHRLPQGSWREMSDGESKPVKGEGDGEGSEHINLKVKGQVKASRPPPARRPSAACCSPPAARRPPPAPCFPRALAKPASLGVRHWAVSRQTFVCAKARAARQAAI